MYKEMVGTLDLRSHTSKSVIPERLSYTHLKKKKKFLKFGTSKSCFDPFNPCNISSDTNTQ